MLARHLFEHLRQGLPVVNTIYSISDHWSHGQLLDLTCRLMTSTRREKEVCQTHDLGSMHNLMAYHSTPTPLTYLAGVT